MNDHVTYQDGEFKTRRFRPKGRTSEYHPAIFAPPDENTDRRSDINYVAQLLAWEIAQKHTHHQQENIQFVVDSLNRSFDGYARHQIIGFSVHVPLVSIWTATRKATFDLSRGCLSKTFVVAVLSKLVDCQESYEY